MLIREAKGTPARVFARFGTFNNHSSLIGLQTKLIAWGIERGVEKHVELDNLNATDVQSKVTSLLS